jgi:hypothetical protein
MEYQESTTMGEKASSWRWQAASLPVRQDHLMATARYMLKIVAVNGTGRASAASRTHRVR